MNSLQLCWLRAISLQKEEEEELIIKEMNLTQMIMIILEVNMKSEELGIEVAIVQIEEVNKEVEMIIVKEGILFGQIHKSFDPL